MEAMNSSPLKELPPPMIGNTDVLDEFGQFLYIFRMPGKPAPSLTKPSGTKLQDEFLREMGTSVQIAALFDLLPEAYFFVKNRQGQFVFANQSIARALGLDAASDR